MKSKLFLITVALILIGCGTGEKSENHMYTNKLINESSPYLLQHAHNPVDWYPWGEEALEKAKRENKLIIISVGYAACHWCHVMEEESYEDEEVARFMNEHFVSIKVDREERPDIDQIYMDAVHLLTGSGGWPLNVIALPDGRPIYGGTYFPKDTWLSILSQVHQYVEENGEKALEQAEALTAAINSSERISAPVVKETFSIEDLDTIYQSIINTSDALKGGLTGAPKFPLPTGHQFLLHYSYLTGNREAEEHVYLTLEKMATGGIYDQIGGGFARYSVDDLWKVPHFEKMLYDNAQLISLYGTAYQKSGRPLFERIVRETAAFVDRELTSPQGAFYSSLDADSEGVEGKFYTWTSEELDKILGRRSEEIKNYYNVSANGNWEPDRNILFTNQNSPLPEDLPDIKRKLLKEREKRVRPALDNKILASWNGMMIKAYADAYRLFDERSYLGRALKAAKFLLDNMLEDGRLDRSYREGDDDINGFLDDYAFVIDSFISLYEATFDEQWLRHADDLTKYVLEHFSDDDSPLFYYTSDLDPQLIARKIELIDNVISSSNSQMAINLYRLGHYFYNDSYIARAGDMAGMIKNSALRGSVHFANWDILMALIVEKPFEVAIVGEDYESVRKELDAHYLPSVFFYGGKEEGNLPLLEYKLVEGKTTIYVCRDRSCLQPVHTAEEALNQINN